MLLFKLYLSKLSKKIPALWQKPKTSPLHYTDQEWFEARVVGKDLLERFFKKSLTKSVKLDGDYTNHSIRATVINTLDNQGYEARHIIQLSSHKSESTVKEYATKCSDTKRKEMFQTLTNAMHPNRQRIEPPAPPSKSPKQGLSITDVKQNLPTFNLEPVDDFDTIDDDLWSNIILDAERLTSRNQTNFNPQDGALVTSTAPVQPPRIHTQVNTINNNHGINIPQIQRIPEMYFPHSNVYQLQFWEVKL